MRIQKIDNDNYTLNFKGNIPKKSKILNELIDIEVKSIQSCYARYERDESFRFFSTLKAMKNDGTDRVLSIKRKLKEEEKQYKRHLDYGEYTVKYGELKSKNINYWDLVPTIIKFGKKLFGQKIITRKPEDVNSAIKLQKIADDVRKKNNALIEQLDNETDIVQLTASQEYKNAFITILNK